MRGSPRAWPSPTAAGSIRRSSSRGSRSATVAAGWWPSSRTSARGTISTRCAARPAKSGADAVHVVDVRRLFVTDYIYPALRADAIYEGRYLLGTSLARPLIARVQVEVALAEGCDALAHGCTGKGNDQVRFELAYQALAPQLGGDRAVARVDARVARGGDRLRERARRAGAGDAEKPYSMDQNLWHLSFESGILEDPWAEPPADMFRLTVDPARGARRARSTRDRLRARRPGRPSTGRALDPVTLDRDAEPPRRRARRRARRHRREPPRGNEEPRRLRDAGRAPC